jgi:hypothetical protein
VSMLGVVVRHRSSGHWHPRLITRDRLARAHPKLQRRIAYAAYIELDRNLTPIRVPSTISAPNCDIAAPLLHPLQHSKYFTTLVIPSLTSSVQVTPEICDPPR